MILGRQSGLGRGLGAIIPPKPAAASSGTSTIDRRPSLEPVLQGADVRPSTSDDRMVVQEIPVHLIDPNPHQPREHFDHAGMEDLVASIKEHGVMQPAVVTQKPDGRYELIAGERRLRASKIAGKETIPVIVRAADEQQKLELAIIENVQRRDLNPLEEARAYLRLQNEFNLTQDQIGERVGKSRPQVANIIRLLQLPQRIQDALAQGLISMSNARTLLSLPTEEERVTLFQAMLQGNFTVRQTEARVPHRRAAHRIHADDPNITQAEQRLRERLGAKVTIKRDARGEGEIRVVFLNDEDLHATVDKILGTS